jgi:hypothetical protein
MDRLLCVIFFFWFAALSGSLDVLFLVCIVLGFVPFVVYFVVELFHEPRSIFRDILDLRFKAIVKQ